MTMTYGARPEGPSQRFVGVDVHYTLDGMLIPTRIYWSDGRVFDIAEARFKGMDSRANARRWSVRIKGRKTFTHLWLASTGRFFVMEKPKRRDVGDF